MFLSNTRSFLLLTLFCVTIFQACGSSQTNENKPVSLTVETTQRFPFPTVEPEIYQADIIIGTGTYQHHWFAARKLDKWRYDDFHGEQASFSQIRSDKLFSIDHIKNVYCEIAESQHSGFPESGNEATRSIFRGVEYHDMDEAGREGAIVKYKVRATGRNGDIFVYFDTANGLVTKQEFMGADGEITFLYEIRNLKMSVDEIVFEIPAGYRRVEASQIKSPAN